MNDDETAAASSHVKDEEFRELDDQLEGPVILPEDERYHEARTIYNSMIDKRPAAIARCENTGDVVRAVSFARRHGLRTAVRGGGHSVAGACLVDGGLVIDLSAMNAVRVDPDRRTAVVQGGATWRDVDQATQEHGLATPGGTVPPTGVGGLTLGGGIGWLMRSHGMSCDNLVRAEVVAASGDIVQASQDENPELFWGLRGGGGNFGVVTEFEFRLHPVQNVLAGLIAHPGDQARDALAFYRTFTQQAPDDVTTMATLMSMPDVGSVAAFGVCYAGEPDRGSEAIQPILDWGEPVQVMVDWMPYLTLQQLLEDMFPDGLHNYWSSSFLKELNDDVIDIAVSHHQRQTSPMSILLLEHFGGAVRDVPAEATAFPHRNAKYNFSAMARWMDPGESATHIAWARQFRDDLKPHSTGGAYVNYLTEQGSDRARANYGPDIYARLADLKAVYDPDNLFSENLAVQPASR